MSSVLSPEPWASAQSPASRVQPPGSSVQSPASGWWDAPFVLRDLAISNLHVHSLSFRVQSPLSRVQSPASRVQNPASRAQSPTSSVQDQVSRIHCPESSIQRPESSNSVMPVERLKSDVAWKNMNPLRRKCCTCVLKGLFFYGKFSVTIEFW